MNYILMHKDIPVLSYTTSATGYVLSIPNIWNYKHIPLEIFNGLKKPSSSNYQMEQNLDLW